MVYIRERKRQRQRKRGKDKTLINLVIGYRAFTHKTLKHNEKIYGTYEFMRIVRLEIK